MTSAIDGCQKAAQLDEEKAMLLHDICCLWIWLRSRMEESYGTDVLERHDGLFMKGTLGQIILHILALY